MADDKKTLKFQMMMSPREARELDDWMFKNRIRSRAEAIRRLCRIGLIWDQHAEPLRKEMGNFIKAYEDQVGNITDIVGEPVHEAPPWLDDYVIATLKMAEDVGKSISKLGGIIRLIGAPSEMMRLEGDFEDIMRMSISLERDAIKDILEEKLQEFEDGKSKPSGD